MEKQQKNRKIPVLLKVVALDKLEFAKRLIQAGHSIHVTDDLGRGVLHNVKSVPMALLFLGAGANVNATDMYGNTPMHEILSEERADIARLFMQAGANYKLKNIFGLTPFDCFVEQYTKQEEPKKISYQPIKLNSKKSLMSKLVNRFCGRVL